MWWPILKWPTRIFASMLNPQKNFFTGFMSESSSDNITSLYNIRMILRWPKKFRASKKADYQIIQSVMLYHYWPNFRILAFVAWMHGYGTLKKIEEKSKQKFKLSIMHTLEQTSSNIFLSWYFLFLWPFLFDSENNRFVKAIEINPYLKNNNWVKPQ